MSQQVTKIPRGPYQATITGIVDGDTFHVDLDLGFGIHAIDFDCRVFGINAPEIETADGKASKSFLIDTVVAKGNKIVVLSESWDKYGGRFDGTVTFADGSDLATLMVVSGHAKWWSGHGPKPTVQP